MKFKIPEGVAGVARELERAGFEAYLVGGCVRDLMIGRTPKDWDITTNAAPEEIQGLFPETFYDNSYGTVGVVTVAGEATLKVIEVTPYRKEGAYSNARHPDTVEFGVSLEEDLKRRDFTINAIAYRPKTGEFADRHDGQKDLERKLVRAVGDPAARFQEDALRMLRAVRISAELGFAIEQETAEAIYANAARIGKISKERVRDELIRILKTDRPMQAVFVAQKLGLLRHIAPELEEGIGVEQNQAHSFDVFEHALRSLQHAADKGWSLPVRTAALFHDVGKPATRRWEGEKKKDWTFHGHEVIGARMTRKALERLRLPKETVDKVTTLVRWHMFFSDPDQVTLSAVRRTIANVGRDNIQDLLNLRICDRIGTGRPKEQPFRLRKYMAMVDEALRDPVTVGMLAIDGNDLMHELGEKPGPRIGWTLHTLLEEVLDEPGKNTREYLLEKARVLSTMEDAALREMGESGKQAKEEADDADVAAIRARHHVD